MCRGPNRSQHFGRILGSLKGAVNRTDAKRYDNFDSKRAQSCEPERCAAGLRHAVTPPTRLAPLLHRPRTLVPASPRSSRHTAYTADAACAAATVTAYLCSSGASRVRAHRVHAGTRHTPPTRLAPLLHRPRTSVPGSPRSSRHTAHTADAACAAATLTAYLCSGLTAFRHTAHNADAACAAATPTAYLCSSGASRVRGLRVFADSPRGACR